MSSSKMHYEKGSFIAQLASMTPSELNDFLRHNGKAKPVNPFTRIDPKDWVELQKAKQEENNHGN